MVAALALALSSGGPAFAVPICVVGGGVPGLEPGPLGDAVAIEARKAGLEATFLAPSTQGECPRDESMVRAAVVPDVGLRIEAAGGSGLVQLTTLEPVDRAGEAARLLVLAAASGLQALPPLLDEDASVVLPGRPDAPPAPGAPVRVLAGAGVRYGFQPGPSEHVGGLDVNVGASFLDEQLAVCLAAAFEWPRDLQVANVSATVLAAEAAARIRGALRLEPFLLAAAVEGGVQWRTLSAESPVRRSGMQDQSVAALIGGEVELAWMLGDTLRLSLVAQGRAYVGGTTYVWLGQTVYEAPDAAVGGAVRVGAIF